jgi:hypothetical protein
VLSELDHVEMRRCANTIDEESARASIGRASPSQRSTCSRSRD